MGRILRGSFAAGHSQIKSVVHLNQPGGELILKPRFKKLVASLSGFAIITVPIGSFAGEVGKQRGSGKDITIACFGCGCNAHLPNAKFYHECGDTLKLQKSEKGR